ncbi:MAG: TonB-dependent receptor plug domain-containing protein, partial [Hyphomonas sp.]
MSKFNSVSFLALSGVMMAGLVALPSQAQEVLRGRIVDGAGSPLPGARVSAVEAGIDTATNRQGEFSFQSVPAGDLTLEVDYLGFPSASRTVSVTAGAANATVITLGEDDQALERVIVRGSILDGTARALNQQRTNDATTSIVSSDAIGRFPDSNIAEALQRVPGFAVQRDQGEGRTIQLRGAPSEFTSVTVNGISIASPSESTRAIDLDTIPSDVVASIEVSKSLLPYQQADSIAGSVNLVTRSPFDRRGLQFNLSGGASHNEIGDTNDYRYSGVVSNTFGPNEQFGALFSASYSQTNRQLDNIENGWGFRNVGGQDIAFSDDFTLKDYDTERTRLAFTGALEFRPDDANRFALNGAWSRFEDKEFRNRLTYDLGTPQPGFTDTTATFTGARLLRQLRNREVENTIWTVSGTGEHDFGAYEIDYTVGFNRTEGIRPQGNELVYRTGANRTVSYDFANPDEPVVSPFATDEQLNLTGLGYRQVVDRTNENIQDEWSAQANFTMEDMFFNLPAQYRFGASARLRETTHDEERWRDRSGAGIFNPGPIAGLLSDNRSQNFSYL